jgi:hypothetical protein
MESTVALGLKRFAFDLEVGSIEQLGRKILIGRLPLRKNRPLQRRQSFGWLAPQPFVPLVGRLQERHLPAYCFLRQDSSAH